MKKRKFGKTELHVSEVGFGAWGIGGPAMAGDVAIGWGDVDDKTSVLALQKAYDLGINFFDTADFYGLGHSEELIGQVFANRDDVIVATKVGHRLASDNSIQLDYSKDYILLACEKSLRRLHRECIDYYQLHSAQLAHLQQGECIEAMEILQTQGKIRYWGLSLNTFNPFMEAQFILENDFGSGLQLVFNVINQRAQKILVQANKKGYGVIARMPLQFGLLTGKFTKQSQFEKNDHRHFRLKRKVLENILTELSDFWQFEEKYKISKTALSLSFVLSFEEISTVIPGIKTPEQARENCSHLVKLAEKDKNFLVELYEKKYHQLVELMEEEEK